jgi:hypothetical protein
MPQQQVQGDRLVAQHHAVDRHPCGFSTRCVDAGFLASLSSGRRGRTTSSPPQLGHLPANLVSAQAAQKVHSKEQMRASALCGGKSMSQHSQFGLS